MNGDGQRMLVWELVPPASPPSGSALHAQAKNRPFSLLRDLEAPRGPDYFAMEKFRRSSRSDGGDTFGRFSRGFSINLGEGVRGGREDGITRTSTSKNNTGIDHSQLSSTISGDVLRTPAGERNARCEGVASCSPAFSQASSTALTPRRRTQEHQPVVGGGFSLFGGKVHTTPAERLGGSGDRGQPPLSLQTQSARGTPGASVAEISRGGVGRGRSNDGGFSRFKTLAQKTLEMEEEDRPESQESSGGNRYTFAARGGHATPSFSRLSPATGVESMPPGLTQLDGVGGSSRHSVDTPSPVTLSSFGSARTPATTATTRKKPRVSRVSREDSTHGRPAMMSGATHSTPSPQIVGPAGGASGGASRTWERMTESGRGKGTRQDHDHHHQQQLKASPSPNIRGQARAGTARRLSGSGSLPSAQPTRKKTSSLSPRGRAGGLGSYSPPPSQPPPPRRYTLDDFAGADDACFNPGASLQGLSIFLERCEASGTVALSMLWADLTTSYSAVTIKTCQPSKSCFRWNCACGRQPRAQQASAPIIGAIIYLPAAGERASLRGLAGIQNDGDSSHEEDFPEGETYLLPLGACVGEDKEAAESGGYQLPLQCEASYDQRWEALSTIVAMPIKKVAFNAQVALMPLITWRRRPESRDCVARAAAAAAAASAGPCGVSMGDGSHQQATDNSSAVNGLFDPRVAAWMLDTGTMGKALEFEALCVSWLKNETPAGGVSGQSSGGGLSSAIVAAVTLAEDCCRRGLALAGKISAALEGAKMLAACEQVEMPAIPVLAGMEVSGVVFLPERVTRFSNALERHLEGLKRTAADAIGGREFNLASPEQVADVLFKHLKLPAPPVKAGSAHASTSADVLARLRGKHAVVAPVLEFRGVHKYKTTYVDKLAERAFGAAAADSAVTASQVAGVGAVRIHAAWNQTSARTGRLSCSRPNLQQIPKSSDPLTGVAGVNVRDAFVASKSFTLMAADYSQIEMRVLADACRDPGLRTLFGVVGEGTYSGGPSGADGRGDVYRKLAAQVLGKQEGEITDAERTRAKVVCLGIIYGMGTSQVAKNLNITDSQAQGLVRSFLRAFPGIEPFLAATRRYAREKGYVCTLTGRRRHLPEINNSRNAAMKAQAERQAVNSVVQGTAADIVKTAMVLVARRLDTWRSSLEEGLDCPRLIMQIHDELVLECPACEEDLERLKGLLVECMEIEAPSMLGIKCPLTVNMLVGMSWGSMRRVVSHDEDNNNDCEQPA